MILQLKQVADVYEAEHGKEKPKYLSRRFIGSIITALSGLYLVQTGEKLEFDVNALSGSIEAGISAIIVLYGTIMGIAGQIYKKEKKK